MLNRPQYPSDVIAMVVLWRLRYKRSLRDLTEMFQVRGFVYSYEAVRDWGAKLTPAPAQELRRRRKGKVGHSSYIDETYIQVHGRWKYLYRAIDRDGVLVDVMLSEHRNPDNNRIEQDHRGIKSRCSQCSASRAPYPLSAIAKATANSGIFFAADLHSRGNAAL